MIQTRIPERFTQRAAGTGEGVYAWTLDGDGNLVPSGETDLSPGQAWEYDLDGNLVPTGDTITDDPYWEYDGDSNLVPAA